VGIGKTVFLSITRHISETVCDRGFTVDNLYETVWVQWTRDLPPV